MILVGPPQQGEVTDDAIAARLAPALEEMSLRDAAKAVADALGVPKSRVYDLGLRARKEARNDRPTSGARACAAAASPRCWRRRRSWPRATASSAAT